MFALVELINACVKNSSAASPSRNRKRKYFQFTLQTKDEERRVVSFLPEKHKHLPKIKAKHSKCELRKCCSNSKEEIIINDYTSVKEIEPIFEKKENKRSLVSVLFVNNEAQLYDVVSITGFVYNVSPIETAEKTEQQIRLRKASLKEHTNEISITSFGHLVEKVEEQTMFSLTDIRLSKYMDIRLLKTTETATGTVSREICFDTENFTDSNHTEVTVYILSVALDTLKQKLMCLKPKCILDLDETVICSFCNTIAALDCCKKKSDVVFSVQVGAS